MITNIFLFVAMIATIKLVLEIGEEEERLDKKLNKKEVMSE